MRTLAKAAEDFYVSLKTHGSTEPFRARMFDFDALNRLIGTAEMLDSASATRRTRRKAAAPRGSDDTFGRIQTGRLNEPCAVVHDESEKVQ